MYNRRHVRTTQPWPAQDRIIHHWVYRFWSIESGDSDLTHDILALEACDGNAYISDLFGARFGEFCPLLSFDEYERLSAARPMGVHLHGYSKVTFEDVSGGMFAIDRSTRTLVEVEFQMMLALMESMRE